MNWAESRQKVSILSPDGSGIMESTPEGWDGLRSGLNWWIGEDCTQLLRTSQICLEYGLQNRVLEYVQHDGIWLESIRNLITFVLTVCG